MKRGQSVYHELFGVGTVLKVGTKTAKVNFEVGPAKTILLTHLSESIPVVHQYRRGTAEAWALECPKRVM